MAMETQEEAAARVAAEQAAPKPGVADDAKQGVDTSDGEKQADADTGAAPAQAFTMEQVSAEIARQVGPIAEEVRTFLEGHVSSVQDLSAKVDDLGAGLQEVSKGLAAVSPEGAASVQADIQQMVADTKKLLADLKPFMTEFSALKAKLAHWL